jgi:hypothetical protein
MIPTFEHKNLKNLLEDSYAFAVLKAVKYVFSLWVGFSVPTTYHICAAISAFRTFFCAKAKDSCYSLVSSW